MARVQVAILAARAFGIIHQDAFKTTLHHWWVVAEHYHFNKPCYIEEVMKRVWRLEGSYTSPKLSTPPLQYEGSRS